HPLTPPLFPYTTLFRSVPKDDEVLIKVHAASVNPLDYHLLRHAFLRRIIFARSKIKIVGRDVAGEVEAVGGNVTQFKAGDNVFGDRKSTRLNSSHDQHS